MRKLLLSIFLIFLSGCGPIAFADEIDDIIPAIIQVESGGDWMAYNKKSGCVGLMQINPEGALAELNNWCLSCPLTQEQPEFRDNMGTGRYYSKQSLHNYLAEVRLYRGEIYRELWREIYTNEMGSSFGLTYGKLPLPKEVLYNPELNQIIGEWYLRRLKDHYLKDNYTIERMLAAYNMEPTRLKKLNYEWWRIPETKKYVKKVMTLYYQLQQEKVLDTMSKANKLIERVK